jgi:hypothetical protein
MVQHAQRVFAVIPGYSDELGQDLPSLTTLSGSLISLPDRILKLSACRHAQLPRHVLRHPAVAPLPGSSLREATGSALVTRIVSQCDRPKQLTSNNSGNCYRHAMPYQQIYDALNVLGKNERPSKRRRGQSNARTGVYRTTYHQYLTSLGWKWTPPNVHRRAARCICAWMNCRRVDQSSRSRSISSQLSTVWFTIPTTHHATERVASMAIFKTTHRGDVYEPP